MAWQSLTFTFLSDPIGFNPPIPKISHPNPCHFPSSLLHISAFLTLLPPSPVRRKCHQVLVRTHEQEVHDEANTSSLNQWHKKSRKLLISLIVMGELSLLIQYSLQHYIFSIYILLCNTIHHPFLSSPFDYIPFCMYLL